MPFIGPLIGIGTSLIGGLFKKKGPQPGSEDMTTTETPTVAPWLSDYIQNSLSGNDPNYRRQTSAGFEGIGNSYKEGSNQANASLYHSGWGGAPTGIQAALQTELVNRSNVAGANYSRGILDDAEKRKNALALGSLPSFTSKTTNQKGFDYAHGAQTPSNPWADALGTAGGILGGLKIGGSGGTSVPPPFASNPNEIND